MKTMVRRWAQVLICAFVVLTVPASLIAQTTAQPPIVRANSVEAVGERGATFIPYSAERIVETTRVLADGTQIHTTRLSREYRDSQGRRRVEMFNLGTESAAGATAAPDFIDIFDPVAGADYSLNTRERTAHKTLMVRPTPPKAPPAAGTTQNSAAPARVNHAPERKREPLGEQTIEGFQTEGTRFTETYPVGLIGNDRPIDRVREQWFSRELREMLLMTIDDPRSGNEVDRLASIVREEQPPELFQVPADYTLIEEQVVRPTPPPE